MCGFFLLLLRLKYYRCCCFFFFLSPKNHQEEKSFEMKTTSISCVHLVSHICHLWAKHDDGHMLIEITKKKNSTENFCIFILNTFECQWHTGLCECDRSWLNLHQSHMCSIRSWNWCGVYFLFFVLCVVLYSGIYCILKSISTDLAGNTAMTFTLSTHRTHTLLILLRMAWTDLNAAFYGYFMTIEVEKWL